jgi:hypothetical protein
MIRRFLKYVELALKTLFLALLLVVIAFLLLFYQSFKDFIQLFLEGVLK